MQIEKVTVFTPTYNRCYIIDKLYKSLLAQTDKRFEWLVVDDGSSDGTREYFDGIADSDSGFPIRYYYKENGGKHRAINFGLPLATGELFFIVDSDDTLKSDAISNLLKWAGTLDDSHKWAGVSGLKGYSDSHPIGLWKTDVSGYVDARCNQRYKYKLMGDKSEAYLTEVLRKYPFPEFEGEKFVVEDAVWNRIASDGYYLRWFNEIIYICDYLDDGLSHHFFQLLHDNPKGTGAWLKVQQMAFPKLSRGYLMTVRTYFKVFSDTKSDREMARELAVPSIVIYALRSIIWLKRKIYAVSHRSRV